MDTSHITHWVFDLDNTLYPPQARLFDQIEVLMNRYIIRELGVTQAQADALRAEYWREYGTTLAGLMAVNGIDPDPFLDEVHELDYAAQALPGQRIIYTNGSRGHGRGVAQARGLLQSFDAVFGIEDALYRPKPEQAAFDKVFADAKVNPAQGIMFEDDPRNLEVPKALGMATVLVSPEPVKPGTYPHIDLITADVTEALQHIKDAAQG